MMNEKQKLLVAKLLLVMPVIVAVYLVVFPAQDPDMFWNLAYGREMVNAGRFINHEVFSYTASGQPLHSHSQLAQVVLYLVYHAAGINGLIAFKVAAMLVVFYLLFSTARFWSATPVMASLIAMMSVSAGMNRFLERPEIFSNLCLSLLIFLLYGYSRQGWPVRALYVLPLLMVVWDYLHGAVYGVVFLFVFVAVQSLRYLFRNAGSAVFRARNDDPKAWTRERMVPLWTWTAVTLAAMLIHPNGLLSYEGFWRVASRAQDFSMYGEFMPPALGLQFLLFWVLFFAVVVLAALFVRSIEVISIMTLLPFGYLALKYNRANLAFAIVAVPVLAQGVVHLARHINKRFSAVAARTIGWAVFVVLLSGVAVYKSGYTIDNFRFGAGLNENYFPVGSVRFVKALGLAGNLYNMDGQGGYLAFHLGPERKIFHYNQPVVFSALNEFVHKPESRSKWNIEYAIIGKPEEYAMFTRDGYVPVYWEPMGMVMVRPEGRFRQVAEQYGIRYFRPLLSDGELKALGASPLTARRLLEETASYLAFRQDARIAAFLGQALAAADSSIDLPARRLWLEGALTYNSESIPLLLALGSVAYGGNDRTMAEKAYLQVLRCDADNQTARLNLGYLRFDRRDYAEAKKIFSGLVDQDQKDAQAWYALGLAEYAGGDAVQAREHFERFLALAPTGLYAQKAHGFIAAINKKGNQTTHE